MAPTSRADYWAGLDLGKVFVDVVKLLDDHSDGSNQVAVKCLEQPPLVVD